MSDSTVHTPWTLTAWGPGQPVPVPDHPLVKNLSLTPTCPPLTQLHAISSAAVTEFSTAPPLPVRSCRLPWALPSAFFAVDWTNEVTSGTLHTSCLLHHHSPSLDAHYYFYVLILQHSNAHPELHQWGGGQSIPLPTGSARPDALQYMVGPFGCQGTLLAQTQLAVT